MTRKVALEDVEQFFTDNPNAKLAEAAAHFDVSIATIVTRRNEAQRNAGNVTLNASDTTVYQTIVGYIAEHAWAPSLRDVVEATGLSLSTVHQSVHRLAAAGSLTVGDGPRMIRVTGSTMDMSEVQHEPG